MQARVAINNGSDGHVVSRRPAPTARPDVYSFRNAIGQSRDVPTWSRLYHPKEDRDMRNLPWYLLGGMGIAVTVEGFLGIGWVPLNILAGVFLFNAAYALYTHMERSSATEANDR